MRDKLLATIFSLSAYFLLLFLLLYYFGYHNRSESRHYVEHNSKAIAVTLGTSGTKKEKTKSSSQEKKKSKPKKKSAKHTKKAPKSTKNPKSAKSPRTPAKHQKKPKKAAKKEAKTAKKSSRKHVDTGKLFSNVKTQQSRTKSQESGKASSGDSTLKKSNNADKGIENRYFAHVEKLLKGWPAQINFAGEEIDVWLKIYKNGNFEFRIKKLSNNTEFNDALISYLKQLQSIGFGPHSNKRPYEIEVSFIAHE